jgi:hypothetical protein
MSLVNPSHSYTHITGHLKSATLPPQVNLGHSNTQITEQLHSHHHRSTQATVTLTSQINSFTATLRSQISSGHSNTHITSQPRSYQHSHHKSTQDTATLTSQFNSGHNTPITEQLLSHHRAATLTSSQVNPGHSHTDITDQLHSQHHRSTQVTVTLTS